MSRVVETPQMGPNTSAKITFTAANALGHEFANTGRSRILVINGAGAPTVVSLVGYKTNGPRTAHDKTPFATVPAGETWLLTTIDPTVYGTTTQYDFTVTASVTHAIIESI